MAFPDSNLAAPPGVKGSGVTHSNAGRFAACGSHGHGGQVGYVLSPTTDRGQYYWEIQFAGATGYGDGGLAGQVYGIGLSSAPYAGTFPYDTGSADSYTLGGANAGVEPNTGVFGTDRVVIGVTGAVDKRWAGIPDGNFGRTLRVAFDAIGGNLWFGDDSVGWYGQGDPAAGINPAVSGISTASDWYPYYVMQNGGGQRWRFREPFVVENPFMAFVEERFPVDISFESSGGPGFNTRIVQTGEYNEQRIARWARARRAYNLVSGVRTLSEYQQIVDFYHAVRGELRGFRFKDWADYKSVRPDQTATNADIALAQLGDAVEPDFQLEKYYTVGSTTHTRLIRKPVSGTILIAVDTIAKTEGVEYNIAYDTGIVTFTAGNIPGLTSEVTWGGEFDTPVRFDGPLEADWHAPVHRYIGSLRLVEVKV